MAPDPVEHRLAAVVHADAAGYSRLMGSDEEAAVRAVGAQRGIVEGVVRQHRGRLVDSTGDAFLAEFPSAVDAVGAALAMQRESAAHNASLPEDRRLRLRVGVHVGDVRVEGERIYGDPIHVAARLQALAEPGAVLISGAVQEQLAGRLPVRTRDLGPQALKHIARPVHAYAVTAGAPEAGSAPPVPGFSGRPAIAVLPFVALAGSDASEYLADGIAEDLITRLATHRDFPVIARNSSFAYRGRSIDVKQIGRELGVAYLIEGSVRRTELRLRVNAQLVDARSGHHLWAERFDRELTDVFAIQDEIVDAVLARVHPEVVRAERERARRSDPASFTAWDCAVLARWHYDHWDRERCLRARELAERALALDPGCAEAVRILQSLEILAGVNQWEGFRLPGGRDYVELARRAMDLSGESWQGWLALGTAQTLLGDFDAGLRALERAVELNPSSSEALVMLANGLARADRPTEALPLLETALRLDPTPSEASFQDFSFALTLFYAGRFEEAVSWAERAVRLAPTHASSHRFLAASLAEAGRLDEARAAVAVLLRRFPTFRISLLEQFAPPQPLTRLAAALRKAGAPE